MDIDEFQEYFDVAISNGSISFEVSGKLNALVVTIPDGHFLVEEMDEIYRRGMESLVPLADKGIPQPTPTLKVGKYTIAPKPKEKRTLGANHIYEFIYAPKK